MDDTYFFTDENSTSTLGILHSNHSEIDNLCKIQLPTNDELTLDQMLHKAIFYHYSLEDIKCLVEHGANVDSRGMVQNTALIESLDYDDVFEFILTKTKDIDAKNSFGNTALALAFENKDYYKAEKLLAAGADPGVADTFKENALDIAFEDGKIDLIKKYHTIVPEDLKGDVLENFQNLIGKGASNESIQRYIDLGVDVNAQDKFGKTPLHIAIENGDIRVVKLLILNGADISKKNTFGDLPLLIAKLRAEHEIYNYLLDIGAKFEEPKIVSNNQDSLFYLFLKDVFKYIKYKIIG